MTELRINTADEQWGFAAGVDGWMDTDETSRFLMNVSHDTLQRLVERGSIRKGKIPGGKKIGYCRRSVVEFAQSLEV